MNEKYQTLNNTNLIINIDTHTNTNTHTNTKYSILIFTLKQILILRLTLILNKLLNIFIFKQEIDTYIIKAYFL